MKTRDIFCASQASTAICMSMDEPSSSSTIQLGGKAIDRHNPIIRDQKRTPRTLPPLAPCTSQTPPINPKPYHLLPKTKKSSEHSKKLSSKSKKFSSKPSLNDDDDVKKKKSTTEFTVSKDIATKSWVGRGDFITPPGSSRYLLGESTRFYDGKSDLDSVLGLVPAESNRAKALINEDESYASKPSSSSRSEKSNSNQVVVLRVSLHCKGCEGKLRKHLSRMQGVTSFNIDFAAKKVTIVGDVTPLGVLASVSKVKNAQFWTAPTIDSTNNLNIGLKK